MASKLYEPPLITAREFLAMDFGDHKAELDNGVIRMMAGGTRWHARVQTNLLFALTSRLRGTGCAAYPSDMAVETHDMSIRYPDVTIFCGHEGPEDDEALAFNDPRVIFEVLSAGTARSDLRIKLDEYQKLASVETIVFVDIAAETVRIVQRTAPNGWSDNSFDPPVTVRLPSFGIELAHDEIFARD
jgi:Uma2 family endonuclease